MSLTLRKYLNVLLSFLVIILACACPEGCAEPGDKNVSAKEEQRKRVTDLGKKTEQDLGISSGLSKKLSALNSASNCLLAADLDAFRPGRTKEDILKDLKWRGDFYMAGGVNGKAACAIIYTLVSDDPNMRGGVWVWAVFVDNRFVKLVKPPPSLPSDQEVIEVRGTPSNRPKPWKAGDDRFLIRGMNSESVSTSELKKQVKSLTAPREQVDPGLSIAYLLVRTLSGRFSEPPPASEKDYLRNAVLRDQFNAARLDIGMTEAEVEGTLKAKPLESGTVDAGQYRIYGSNESFDIIDWLRFSNILIIYRHGKVIAISSVPSGDDWRRKLAESTIDLPKRDAATDSSGDRK